MNSTDSTDSTDSTKWIIEGMFSDDEMLDDDEIDKNIDNLKEEYLRQYFVKKGLMPANSNKHVCAVPCVNATLPEAEAAEAALKEAEAAEAALKAAEAAAEKAKAAEAAAEKAEEAKTAKAAEEAESDAEAYETDNNPWAGVDLLLKKN